MLEREWGKTGLMNCCYHIVNLLIHLSDTLSIIYSLVLYQFSFYYLGRMMLNFMNEIFFIIKTFLIKAQSL